MRTTNTFNTMGVMANVMKGKPSEEASPTIVAAAEQTRATISTHQATEQRRPNRHERRAREAILKKQKRAIKSFDAGLSKMNGVVREKVLKELEAMELLSIDDLTEEQKEKKATLIELLKSMGVSRVLVDGTYGGMK